MKSRVPEPPARRTHVAAVPASTTDRDDVDKKRGSSQEDTADTEDTKAVGVVVTDVDSVREVDRVEPSGDVDASESEKPGVVSNAGADGEEGVAAVS